MEHEWGPNTGLVTEIISDAPGVTRVIRNGQQAVLVETEAATALIYRHGAHLTSFQPQGFDEVLWVSGSARYKHGKAIRGGVPVCFPWFGPAADADGRPEDPQHGFARNVEWAYMGSGVCGAQGEGVRVTFRLTHDDIHDEKQTREMFSPDFVAEMVFEVGSDLHMHLTVHNPGEAPFKFGEALHTYLAVQDIGQTEIQGLVGLDYIDQLKGMATFTDDANPRLIAEEVDRIYQTPNLNLPATVVDKARGLSVQVTKAHSAQTVLWNPWVDKAAAMGDYDDDGYRHMVCIEAVNTRDGRVTLAPGASHTMTQSLTVNR